MSLQKFTSLSQRFGQNAGQATMEYILILVVAVSLLLALTAQIFTPLQSFVQGYMGDYVACLLESGELPTLGGENRIQDPEGCEAKFDTATLAKGRPRTGDGSDGSATSGGKKSKNDSGNNGSQGTYAGSAGRTSSYFNSPPPRSGSADSSSQNPKVVEISLGATEEAGTYGRSNSSAYGNNNGSRLKGIINYDLSVSDQKKAEDVKKSANRVVASDFTPRAVKKIAVKPPGKTVDTDIEAPAFGLGDYLRYLLIIAIIIILVSLIGGQVLRLSKGWQK